MLYMILTGLFCGGLLGFVMQRGRFCLTGGFRDMYIAKDNRMFYALLIATGREFGLGITAPSALFTIITLILTKIF